MSSHVDKKVDDKLLKWLNKQHRECGRVKATRGNKHDCLGMTFRFRDRKVEMDVVECIENVLKEFPVEFKEINENTTPAGVDTFREDLSKKLNKEMRTIFIEQWNKDCLCANKQDQTHDQQCWCHVQE